ncbi:MAG: GNAT family N-acetyltransferase [Bacteroidaceae bacterium]|nr:GNAT family N-acetyltransferase [Bacteroidaceae bacterium]
MKKAIINIRQAQKTDALLIAKAVAMGIGDEDALRRYCGEDYISLLTEIAQHEESQYSYNNALIAVIDGTPVGAVIGYDGAKLHHLRDNTYNIIYSSLERTPSIPDETEAGEFYLDTVAVMPEYSSMGIGRSMITAICNKAFADGHKNVGLIVDHDNSRAEALYTSIGFTRVGEKEFFGHRMWHMQKKNA